MVTDYSRSLLKLARHYHSGHLPIKGSLADQPHSFLEAMEFIPSGIFK